MKEVRGFNIPMTWSGVRPKIEKDCNYLKKSCLEQAIAEGFTVTHITSSTVNDVMFVYHFLEREVKE